MRLALIFAILFWKQSFSEISEECKGWIVEDIAETGKDFCNGIDLIDRKLETDFDWHDIKKCCGESNNFHYDCDVRFFISIDLLLSTFQTLITCYD